MTCCLIGAKLGCKFAATVPRNRRIVDCPTFSSAKIKALLILTVAASSQNRNGCRFAPLHLFLGSSCSVALLRHRPEPTRCRFCRPDACSSGTLQNHQIGDFELPRPQPSTWKTVSDLDVPRKMPQIRKFDRSRCPGHRLRQSHPVGRVQTCLILPAGIPVVDIRSRSC